MQIDMKIQLIFQSFNLIFFFLFVIVFYCLCLFVSSQDKERYLYILYNEFTKLY
jgi:hypothetical protein